MSLYRMSGNRIEILEHGMRNWNENEMERKWIGKKMKRKRKWNGKWNLLIQAEEGLYKLLIPSREMRKGSLSLSLSHLYLSLSLVFISLSLSLSSFYRRKVEKIGERGKVVNGWMDEKRVEKENKLTWK